MRAEVNGVHIRPFGAQQGFHLIVDFLQFTQTDLAAGDHRLIGHNNGQISGLIDLSDCRSRAGHQLKIIDIPQKADIFVDRSVPV